jgi:hypothetical protein
MAAAPQRAAAADIDAVSTFYKAGRRVLPILDVRIQPPMEPVFNLKFLKEPRTRPYVIHAELTALLGSKSFTDFVEHANRASTRFEDMGIFEEGSVQLYLERRNPNEVPYLVFQATEKDLVRLKAEPKINVHGSAMNVRSAEVWYPHKELSACKIPPDFSCQ